MACIVMVVMACIVMAFSAMAYIFLACIVMAYTVMAEKCYGLHSCVVADALVTDG